MLSLDSNVTEGDEMQRVGYARVSTEEQNLERQDLGEVDRLFSEKKSGSTRERPALAEMVAFVRTGDEVVVFSIDRLARDLRDLEAIISELNNKGVSISFLQERLTFSGDQEDALARLQLQMMGAFAEFERAIIRKRQAEGIAKAKARGVYKGRKKTIDATQVKQLKSDGMSVADIARTMKISRMSVYRNL